MTTTLKKSNKAQSIAKVSSLAQFEKWVAKIGGQNMLFRGLANAEWGVESSLYRRLILNGLEYIDSAIFLEMTKIFINDARKQGYGIENNRILNDLELLTITRHYGAANCLIDFTQAPLVALCFACGVLYNKDKKANGKVIAFDKSNADLYDEISIENSSKKIGHWLTEHEKNKKNWIFSPQMFKHQEPISRVTAQQSVFVFGSPTLSVENFYICEITNKKEILEELKKNDISAKILFNDFFGFSTQNSYDKKYENWDTGNDFVSGIIYQAYGDLKSAIKYYDKAIVSNPQDSAAYNNRGIAKGKLGKFQDAISDFDEAIRLNPKEPAAHNNHGLAKRNLGEFQDAISDYDEAIRLNPKDWAAYNNRGLTKRNLNKFQDAISDYDEAIRLNPKFYEAYSNRGIAKNNLDKFQDAIGDCNEAIRLNPKSYEAYNNRGLTKNNWGKFQNAISDYDKAIRLNPQYSIAYNNRGIAKDNLGKLQDAISDYNEAIRLDPQYSVAYNNRGIAKKNLGEFQDAISDYNKSIKLNSKYWEAYANRGNAKMKSGDIKGAAADFAKAKELNPELELPDLPPDNSDK